MGEIYKTYMVNPNIVKDNYQIHDSEELLFYNDELKYNMHYCPVKGKANFLKENDESKYKLFEKQTIKTKMVPITGVRPLLKQPYNNMGLNTMNRENIIIHGQPNRISPFFCHDREKSINRFEPLSRDLQEFSVEPFIRGGVSTSSLNKQIHMRRI
jgi:hypothetical protein